MKSDCHFRGAAQLERRAISRRGVAPPLLGCVDVALKHVADRLLGPLLLYLARDLQRIIHSVGFQLHQDQRALCFEQIWLKGERPLERFHRIAVVIVSRLRARDA